MSECRCSAAECGCKGPLVRLETRELVFSGANRVVVDWDATCVEGAWPDMGDWLPGATDALRRFLDAGLEVAVFSTRLAPMDVDEVTPRRGEQGAEVGRVRRMLNDAGLNEVRIWLEPWKPGAVAYIDDKAVAYKGDWPSVVREVAELAAAASGRRPDSRRNGFRVKDSGERIEFPSGMMRDTQEGKTNFLLIRDGPMFERWAEHMTAGAEKYGERNWTLAGSNGGSAPVELERFRNSAARHFEQWLSGDTDEDHAAAVFFNVNAAEYVAARAAEGR